MAQFRLTTTQVITRVYVIEAESSDQAYSTWANSLDTTDAFEQDYADLEKFQDAEEVTEV